MEIYYHTNKIHWYYLVIIKKSGTETANPGTEQIFFHFPCYTGKVEVSWYIKRRLKN